LGKLLTEVLKHLKALVTDKLLSKCSFLVVYLQFAIMLILQINTKLKEPGAMHFHLSQMGITGPNIEIHLKQGQTQGAHTITQESNP
jgi:lipopolysaccharide/colanic/teichoic acid biosynthesis glycosyltransferase